MPRAAQSIDVDEALVSRKTVSRASIASTSSSACRAAATSGVLAAERDLEPARHRAAVDAEPIVGFGVWAPRW